jgi:hypothetical protein
MTHPLWQADSGFRILKRFDFFIRQRITTGHRLSPDLERKIGNFVLYCERQDCFSPSSEVTGNMDETAICSDIQGETTIETRGARHVPVLITGQEKVRITVCLAVLADGRKLPPMIVFKGKRMSNEVKKFPGVVTKMTPNGWVQVDTTISWVNAVWGSLALGRRMLVWDSYRCHLANEVKQCLKAANAILACIPGGCKKFLQPAV